MLLLSSSASATSQADREAAGIRHCLHKPVRRADLFRAICQALGAVSVERPDATSANRPSAAQLHGSVLVVEDNPVNQVVASAMLEKFGVRVRLAENGQEAIARVAAEHFDLVLMDCQMPVMDGYAATAAIRARVIAGRAPLPIIAVTANAMPGDEQKCREAGMDGFLAKPFTLQQLQDVLAQWLPAAAGQAMSRPAARFAAVDAEPAFTETINYRTLDSLRELDRAGDGQLLATVLRMFLETAAANLQSVRRAIAGNDGAQLSRTAHAMASNTANIGADALALLYRRLEVLGREGQLQAAAQLLDEIEREQQRAVARVGAILAQAA